MKLWVLTIIAVQAKLSRLCEMIDEKVLKLACNSYYSPAAYDDVLWANDIKRRVVNFKVFAEFMLRTLDCEEQNLILQYISCKSMQDVADSMNISKSAIYRKLEKIVKKCCSVLGTFGCTDEKLHSDYDEIQLISRSYKQLKRSFSKETYKKEEIDRSAVSCYTAFAKSICALCC